MAKGTESKAIIFNKLKEFFPDSFWEDENKILRVPLSENGDIVEIKVTLTAAKNNLGNNVVESAFSTANEETFNFMPPPEKTIDVEVTEEEKERVAHLLASLGL